MKTIQSLWLKHVWNQLLQTQKSIHTPICHLKTVSCIGIHNPNPVSQLSSWIHSLDTLSVFLEDKGRRKGRQGRGQKKPWTSSKEDDLPFPFHRFLLRLGINNSLFLAVILPDNTRLFLPQCPLHTDEARLLQRCSRASVGILSNKDAWNKPNTVKWSDSCHPRGYLPGSLGKELLLTGSQKWAPTKVQKITHTSRVKGQKCGHSFSSSPYSIPQNVH